MKTKEKDKLRYGMFWLWAALVSVAVWYIYYKMLLDMLPNALTSLLRVEHIISDSDAETQVWFWVVLQGVLFLLFWWRVVKVLVLHGSPFHIGVTVSEGREDNGRAGRMVHRIWIGDMNVHVNDYKGRFWYGAVFRSHPSSDKLVRSRLEMLVLALPLTKCTLHIQESRVFLRNDDHESRARKYRLVADKYAKTREETKPDAFRTKVVEHLDHVGRHFHYKNNITRIDGLNWDCPQTRRGFVSDDFQHRLTFDRLANGTFKVSKLGPNGDREKVVNSVNELRAVVKADFEAIWEGRKTTP